ncbi:unnamed protein product [Chrysodeixis includens]|uniref:EGF-like domain-containing protein n=1 Tax=Chrysodeixis includens TaxID=689277 RepID=A0A9P0FSN8_CHRIL|nr:unnamed protein product [Chrysodeixis includens]
MLVVTGFFILTFTGGVFSATEPEKCKDEESCLKHEYFTKNNPICVRTCANRLDPVKINCDPYTGCACEEGYVRKYEDGTGPCIRETKCGGNPTCGANKTYVNCNVGCPNNYCPRDDSRGIVACDPPYPCPGGCACNSGYLILSDEDNQCVLSSECPPVNCTRPNEVWDPNPTKCFDERCGSKCENNGQSAPRCVCKDGFFRNDSDICVPESECPTQACNGDPNASFSSCLSSCPKTCSNKDKVLICPAVCSGTGCKCNPGYVLNDDGLCVKPEECPASEGCNGDPNAEFSDCITACPRTCENQEDDPFCPVSCDRGGCVCKSGFVLNTNGSCIKPEECTGPRGCNGDPNAQFSECPSACPLTCNNKEIINTCAPACERAGCECKPGFVLNDSGLCIKPKECPGGSPRCAGNQTYVDCTACATDYCPTSGSRGFLACSIAYPCPGGCACTNGYSVISYEDPRCILTSDCPPPDSKTKCSKPNEIWDENPSACYPEKCENRDGACDDLIKKIRVFPRCVCAEGYYRNKDNDCVPESECPPIGCNGDPNAMFSGCLTGCPRTCEDQEDDEKCPVSCDSGGCVCKPGFVLNPNGTCIKPEQCTGPRGCNGDPNAKFSDCPSVCPVSCDNKEQNATCSGCGPAGCECKPNYVLNSDGRCVKPKDCPGGSPTCPANQTYVDCTVCASDDCATLDIRGQFACSIAYPCPGGCVCSSGYASLSYEDQRCVLISECPPITCTRPNEVWDPKPTRCYRETCEDRDNKECYVAADNPRCVCKEGYYRNVENVCVPESECPPLGCNGDLNATFSFCLSGCPETCKNKGEDIICTDDCKGTGCACKSGYVLNDAGLCIKPEDCPGSPTCSANQTYVDCTTCATNYCPIDDNRGLVSCAVAYPCPSGCVCKSGYLALSYEDNQCILASECPPVQCTRPNEEWNPNPSDCYSEKCSDTDGVCEYVANDKPRCVCKEGYLRNDDQICIPKSQCPPGCNGDRNATFNSCLSACPITCANQNEAFGCIDVCKTGCDCNLGYVLNQDTGLCVKPIDCPGGKPTCGVNETYVDCLGCSTNYCPTSDSRGIVECSIAYPCPGGCTCSNGYLALSAEDKRCVLASECPPVQCTRPNEVWDPKPSKCYSEKCDDRESFCLYTGPDKPRCVCLEGFYRNEDDICVPQAECPPIGCGGDQNATFRGCLSPCRTTCANRDQSFGCPAVCSGAGCDCNPGYVYNEFNQCIKPEDCPADPKCNGDRNATFQFCPSSCRASCDNPEQSGACSEVCAPEGCGCKNGYILLPETGQCVAPIDCPGGIPKCPANESYQFCKISCLTDYCPANDSLTSFSCNYVFPCRGGCVCEEGYLRLSNENPQCVPSAECPPVECTRPNEIWDPNPSGCLLERCEEMGSDCDIPIQPYPKCVCEPGYFRNASDICVPAAECPSNGCKGDLNASYRDCLSACPTTCANKDLNIECIEVCMPAGCVCNDGYVMLSDTNDICIKIEDCPAESQCGGDRNATFKTCPSPCHATCDNPESFRICPDVCDPDGCVCKSGYLLTQEEDGKCVDPSDCPGGSPTCPANEEYVDCKVLCPSNYCPTIFDDSSSLVICDPIFPCPGGCVCKEGHLRFNETDDRCVPVSECPQLECTKPNEVWEPNPPKCLRERCDSRNLDCDFQIQQPPRCICKPGYFRNQDDVCVLASECSAPQPKCGLNEVSVPCRTVCPPQNCEIPYTDYACTEETKICEPGCDCLPNHLRNGSGICVPNEECPYPSTPVCGINEIARDCKTLCPPQTCLSKYALFRCIDEIPCEPGCDCVANYLRDENGKCVPSEKCPPLPPACSVSEECKRTCASPNPPNCPYLPPEENIDGCNCKMGYVLSTSGGVCVKIEECPSELACNGDQNARPKQCPLPCPSTCESPDAVPCKKMCDPIGCECKPGFILSNITGQCILPNQCPGGNPCGDSGRFVYCKSSCPQDYCPTDDSRGIIACDPSPECLSGCICDLNHKRKSIDDPTCVVSSDCPPVQCTRPNEEWSGCPSACLQERCEDIHNRPIQCNTLVLNCQPSCVCKKDHFRNATDICIPAKDCPC